MNKYVELIKDRHPYKKGTQFEVTHEDDGMWSLYAFYAGEIDGMPFSCEWSDAKWIENSQYSGKVIRSKPAKYKEPDSYGDYYSNFP